jgi:hypothetical protein
MMHVCKLCKNDIAETSQAASGNITEGICGLCALRMSGPSGTREMLEAIDAPVLLMQGNPRQVVTANTMALELFAKDLPEVEGRRGGQVFDCVHSFTEAGCGKDSNCENCPIKNAIVDTFATAAPHRAVLATLPIRKPGRRDDSYVVQVSTEKIGELALVRIERYDPT